MLQPNEGTTTVSLVSILWLLSHKYKLPPRVKTATNALLFMTYLQVVLGISTLLMYVPTTIAATHQSGSLLLVSLATWLTHELKYVKKIVRP